MEPIRIVVEGGMVVSVTLPEELVGLVEVEVTDLDVMDDEEEAE